MALTVAKKTREMINYLVAFILVGFMVPCSESWHDFDNFQYDCWPEKSDNFDASNNVPCEGLGLMWIIPPNKTVFLGETFNVSYKPVISARFYNNMARSSTYFSHLNTSAEIKEFCENETCPSDTTEVGVESCCVHHANIHVCAPTVTFCGPWVQPGERVSTHTRADWGTINTTYVAPVVINTEGRNFMIAHLKVGGIQIALGQEIRVIPKPVCGDGSCQKDYGESCDTCKVDCCVFPAWAIALIVIVCVCIPIAVLIGVLVWYFYQKHKLLYDESWIVNYNDIQKDHGYRGFMGSLVSFQWTPEVGTQQNGDMLFSNSQKRQLFTQTGVYDGRTVAIKKVQKLTFSVTMTVRKEVRQLRELDHPNLCKFIGASVEAPELAILTEYCPKGSLNDVLQNDEIPLNWGFRFSFARDIARAMAYLHQRKINHGHLKSSNCIIDDRWVLKITDYGLATMRQADGLTNDVIHQARQQACKVYVAPEIRVSGTTTPTAPGDVYSYAILLVEIATRVDPYSEDMDINGIRPQLSDLNENECPSSQGYLELFEKCLMHNPLARPTFDNIKKMLHKINPSHESPVDNMMLMMEKYSKHLEVMVAERTQELLAEQKKTDQLLHSMLPSDVAKDLRQGKPADARSFESATIYFSDIVGFTSLASQSTPMQVVNMLNELYTMFDYILDRFDVYKVETIGDAYMVVSGVPRENGINHATEIACMALEMISVVERFKIPHKVTEKLKIRVGIHSGPVVAGVVGTKMPRYCLFGDTVNTASRMETASEAMKIHVSNSCAQLLLQAGGFELEKRGTIQVKGKEPMVTWWLNGTDRKGKHLMSPKPSVSSISTNKDFLKDTQLDKIELPGTVCE